MLQETFYQYKAELDNIVDPDLKSKRAIEILNAENLSLDTNSFLVAFNYINHTIFGVTAWYYYILEAAMPYYKTTPKPEWYKRFAYWPATAIIENYLQFKKFIFRDEQVTLRFSQNSGDHTTISAGYGNRCPDFHIYLQNEEQHNYLVEYKFASYKRFKNIQQVADYYEDGKHLHGAKILISFLEQEEKFYIIDYEKYKIYDLPFKKPDLYIGTDFIDGLKDPLA